MQYLSDLMVWFALSFSLGVFLTSDLVIKFLYGSRYKNAADILGIYAVTTIPVFFNLARIKWLSLERRLNDWLITSCLCLSLNLVGHLLLVKDYGVKGVIMSFLISQLLGNLILGLFLKTSREALAVFVKTLLAPVRIIAQLQSKQF